MSKLALICSLSSMIMTGILCLMMEARFNTIKPVQTQITVIRKEIVQPQLKPQEIDYLSARIPDYVLKPLPLKRKH